MVRFFFGDARQPKYTDETTCDYWSRYWSSGLYEPTVYSRANNEWWFSYVVYPQRE